MFHRVKVGLEHEVDAMACRKVVVGCGFCGVLLYSHLGA